MIITVHAENKATLDALYQKLSNSPLVLIVLRGITPHIPAGRLH
ncbi:hypothetical protein [Coxiella-like endosymbiont]